MRNECSLALQSIGGRKGVEIGPEFHRGESPQKTSILGSSTKVSIENSPLNVLGIHFRDGNLPKTFNIKQGECVERPLQHGFSQVV